MSNRLRVEITSGGETWTAEDRRVLEPWERKGDGFRKRLQRLIVRELIAQGIGKGDFGMFAHEDGTIGSYFGGVDYGTYRILRGEGEVHDEER